MEAVTRLLPGARTLPNAEGYRLYFPEGARLRYGVYPYQDFLGKVSVAPDQIDWEHHARIETKTQKAPGAAVLKTLLTLGRYAGMYVGSLLQEFRT